MTINQTKHFRDDVNHMVKIGNEYKHVIFNDGYDIFSDLLDKLIRYRGMDYAKLAASKANQRLHAKIYNVKGE